MVQSQGAYEKSHLVRGGSLLMKTTATTTATLIVLTVQQPHLYSSHDLPHRDEATKIE